MTVPDTTGGVSGFGGEILRLWIGAIGATAAGAIGLELLSGLVLPAADAFPPREVFPADVFPREVFPTIDAFPSDVFPNEVFPREVFPTRDAPPSRSTLAVRTNEVPVCEAIDVPPAEAVPMCDAMLVPPADTVPMCDATDAPPAEAVPMWLAIEVPPTDALRVGEAGAACAMCAPNPPIGANPPGVANGAGAAIAIEVDGVLPACTAWFACIVWLAWLACPP